MNYFIFIKGSAVTGCFVFQPGASPLAADYGVDQVIDVTNWTTQRPGPGWTSDGLGTVAANFTPPPPDSP